MVRQFFRNLLGRFTSRPTTTETATINTQPHGLDELKNAKPVKKVAKQAPKPKARRELSLTRERGSRPPIITTSPLIDAMNRFDSGMRVRYDRFRKSATVVQIIGRHKKPLAVLADARGRQFRRPVLELNAA